MVITIDGPAGAGKSTIAKRAAKELGINYLDTGALYRAVGLILAKSEVKPEFLHEALSDIKIEINKSGVYVNDFDVTKEIRTPEADELASKYSALPEVRAALLNIQREQAKIDSIIAEGRDLGSVVFPDAEFKFFLTATPEARAKRRYNERIKRGESANYDEILDAIKLRDEHDSHREISPLKIPEGAIYLDTSDMTEQEVLNFITNRVNSHEAK
ncbi:MAG: (d)CMP kinase [Synergistaceae bacterium]|nr:(d)CMP kinase [Synergistaceae bacterium]